MAIKIFSASHLSSFASQSVSTIRLNIFKCFRSDDFEYWTTADKSFQEQGAIKIVKTQTKSRFFRYLIRFFWLWKIKPELIIFTGEPMELPFLFFHPRNSKTILHLNGSMPYPISSFPYRTPRYDSLWLSISLFLKKVDGVITVSGYSAHSLEPFEPRVEVKVIYNGVDLESFAIHAKDCSVLKEKFGIDSKKPIVVDIGSLIELKRPDLYFELSKLCPEYDFVLVGSGDSKFSKNLVKKFSSQNNFFWLPSVQRQDLPLLLSNADSFCFPSTFEGFGMVVAEAMACGLPAVVSADSGPEELVGSDCGIIIRKQDTRQKEVLEFAKALKSIIENRILREKMAQDAREKAQKEFDWNKLALSWSEFLKKFIV